MNAKTGWVLLLAGVLLLAALGRLDLLVLLPVAAVLAYTFARLGHRTRA
jgi:hypothetical protein